mmetsp:Transcript_20749/g.38967  ORF Transcript_20749/g.38967 Transcript_20749/m.38967 type:complete len:94 (-) Transcript_20749:53-334(-)
MASKLASSIFGLAAVAVSLFLQGCCGGGWQQIGRGATGGCMYINNCGGVDMCLKYVIEQGCCLDYAKEIAEIKIEWSSCDGEIDMSQCDPLAT